MARRLNDLGVAARLAGDSAAARARYEEALRIQREDEALWGEAVTLGNLGALDAAEGRHSSARERLGRALTFHRGKDDVGAVARTLARLGRLELLAGRPDVAYSYFDRAHLAYRACRRLPRAVTMLELAAKALAAGGKLTEAERLQEEAARLRDLLPKAQSGRQ